MEEIGAYLAANWVPWLFAGASWAGMVAMRYIGKRAQAERREEDAIARGVEALLRENIVQNYNLYSQQGFCPIYAKDSAKRVYSAYHALGGNDVATELYQKILHMEEQPKEGAL